MSAIDLQKLRDAAEAEFAASRNASPAEDSTDTEQQPSALAQAVEADANTPEAPASQPRSWKREIDLGDGSGVQVFEAPTKDELLDKLANAQLHATRKIKELNRKVKEGGIKTDPLKPATKFEVKSLTAEEQFMLGQELQTNPTGAIAKLFKSTVGVTPDELREVLADAKQVSDTAREQREGAKFIASRPEYLDSDANKNVMVSYLQKNNLAFTANNLEIAFDDLVDAGLVATKEQKETPAAPVQKTVRRRASVGISPRTSSADDVEPEPKGPSVEEFRKLSQEERRRIVLRTPRR